MIRLNIHEAKTHLSRYLERVRKGEVILLCRRNVPVAEIRSIPNMPRKKRPIGVARGEYEVGPRFFEPLPPEMLEDFEGRGGPA